MIEEGHEERSYRLAAGSVLLYPSYSLHRVNPVTRGERWVCVGWIQSSVRDPRQREILFELDTVRRALFAREGKSDLFDRLSHTHSNLLRIWAE